MIDHASLPVRDFQKSKAFYAAVLKPLGYKILTEGDGYAGMGATGWSDFWIGQKKNVTPQHIGFWCDDHATVDAFYEAALEAGGKDNGAPGIRADYHPSYYAAFILDPDGHNIEAVFHEKG
jgi:catechol 2,3-dioxygenase-like lactoylglutathione lyase family enzyme